MEPAQHGFDGADRGLTWTEAAVIIESPGGQLGGDGRPVPWTQASFNENNLTGYSQAVLEIEDSGLAKSRRYDFADDLITQVDDPDSPIESAHHFLYDGLGSTRSLTNEVATVEAAYNYTPFGSPLGFALNADQPHLFAGEWFDASLGYSYNRARYYDTGTGRFKAFDPVEDEGNRLHRYVYCGGDSVNNVDPTGLFTAMAAVGAGLGAGEIAAMTTNASKRIGAIAFSITGISLSEFASVTYGDIPRKADQIAHITWLITKDFGLLAAGFIPILGQILDLLDLWELIQIAISILGESSSTYPLWAKAAVLGLLVAIVIAVIVPHGGRSKPLLKRVLDFITNNSPRSHWFGSHPKDATLVSRIPNVEKKRGNYDFFMHGNRDGVNFNVAQGPKDAVIIPPDVVAERILYDNSYTGGPIRLISCHTGRLPDGAAQRIADLTGVKVLAPTGRVWISQTGKLTLEYDLNNVPGRWKTFSPRKGG